MTDATINIHRDIVKRCKNNDPDAQCELYRLYAKAMFNISFRITNNREDAEDVLQEAFVNAFQNIQRFKGESTIGAWLKRIVVNHSINYIKKKKFPGEPLDGIELSDNDEEYREVDEVIINSKVERVKELIMQLPDGYRIIFSLYLLEGYDHREIAKILGIAESTSKSQLNRAKNKLKDLLNTQVNYG